METFLQLSGLLDQLDRSSGSECEQNFAIREALLRNLSEVGETGLTDYIDYVILSYGRDAKVNFFLLLPYTDTETWHDTLVNKTMLVPVSFDDGEFCYPDENIYEGKSLVYDDSGLMIRVSSREDAITATELKYPGQPVDVKVRYCRQMDFWFDKSDNGEKTFGVSSRNVPDMVNDPDFFADLVQTLLDSNQDTQTEVMIDDPFHDPTHLQSYDCLISGRPTITEAWKIICQYDSIKLD